MPPWAFCESLRADVATVTDAEAHHLLHVLRLKTGDSVTLFDGSGTTALAVIVSFTRRDLICTILSRHVTDALTGPRITVAVSPPKGDRFKWMVEKLTEIGVHRMQLMDCDRTIAIPGETKVDKLKATMLAACKQCRRSVFPEIQPLLPFRDVIDAALKRSDTVYVAHPGGSTGCCILSESNGPKTILVGPEGGFTDAEIEYISASGIATIAWPQTILRIETAAIVFATLAAAAAR